MLRGPYEFGNFFASERTRCFAKGFRRAIVTLFTTTRTCSRLSNLRYIYIGSSFDAYTSVCAVQPSETITNGKVKKGRSEDRRKSLPSAPFERLSSRTLTSRTVGTLSVTKFGQRDGRRKPRTGTIRFGSRDAGKNVKKTDVNRTPSRATERRDDGRRHHHHHHPTRSIGRRKTYRP